MCMLIFTYIQQNGRAPMSETNLNKPPSVPPKEYGKANTRGIRKTCNHRCVNKNVYPFQEKMLHVKSILLLQGHIDPP